MKKQFLKTLVLGLSLLAILLFSVNNTPTIALPAADNLGPGKSFSYILTNSMHTMALNNGDTYNNQTGDHLSTMYSNDTDIMNFFEKSDVSILGTNMIENGMYMANANGNGERNGTMAHYHTDFAKDLVNNQVISNNTFGGQNSMPTETFSQEDRSFVYNNTQVPVSDFVLMILIEGIKGDDHNDADTSNPALQQDMENNSVIDNFFNYFEPIFQNSTSTGSGDYVLNGNTFTLNTLTRTYYNVTIYHEQGSETNLFNFENYTDLLWYYDLYIYIEITVDVTYDSATGMLLVGDLVAHTNVTMGAYTVIENYDPDGDGPAPAINLLVKGQGTFLFDGKSEIKITNVSYLYQSGGNPSSSTSNTETNNTEANNNSASTPLLNLPGPSFTITALALTTSFILSVIIRKRK